MAYQVIARKYRPQHFEEVIGQDHVTRTLSHAIDQNRIAHAYLFCGPRGTGKTTLARIFAKCLNCQNGPSTHFDDDDERCQEIAEGRSLDVIEIDGASNRGIEEIRELRDTIRYAPSSSKFKIYIIDEVHMLTKEAFNALLKTLEEPPKHAKFMFATTEPERVLPTILSRCQRFDLRPISIDLIVKHLSQIASLEKVKVEKSALQAIARGAEGGMRDAQSMLDQLISFCGESISEADVLSMFGVASRDQVIELVNALFDGKTLTMLQCIDALLAEGKEAARLLDELLAFFRNLMLFQLSNQNAALLQVSETELRALKKLAGRLPFERLSRVIEVLSECDYRIKNASSKRIFFEIALIKSIEATKSISINEVLKTLKNLRSETDEDHDLGNDLGNENDDDYENENDDSRIKPFPKIQSSQSSENSKVSQNSEKHLTQSPSDLWKKTLASLKFPSKIASVLKLAHPIQIEGKSIFLTFPSKVQKSLASIKGKYERMIIDELRSAGLEKMKIEFVFSDSSCNSNSSNSEDSDSENDSYDADDAKEFLLDKDPVIENAMKIFKGQRVRVKKV